MKCTMIAALAENRAIGYEGKLIYSIAEDKAHFKRLTQNKTVIMGRKTFESLGGKPLPKRRNIVISRTLQNTVPGVTVYASLEEALKGCEPECDVFVIGGAEIYQAAMPYADELIITHINNKQSDKPENADAFFPKIDSQEWITENLPMSMYTTQDGLFCMVCKYERIKKE